MEHSVRIRFFHLPHTVAAWCVVGFAVATGFWLLKDHSFVIPIFVRATLRVRSPKQGCGRVQPDARPIELKKARKDHRRSEVG